MRRNAQNTKRGLSEGLLDNLLLFLFMVFWFVQIINNSLGLPAAKAEK